MMTPKIATTILEQYRRQQLVAAALRAAEKRAVGLSDAGPGSGVNLSPDAPLTNGPRKFTSANVENKDGLDFFATSGARQLGLAHGVPGHPARSRFSPQPQVQPGQPLAAATARPDPRPVNPRVATARAIANMPPASPQLAQDVSDVQQSVQQGKPMPISMQPGPLDNLPTEYTQQPAPAPPPMAPGNAQYADANPDGSVNWDSVRPDASVPYTPPATSVADSSTASGGEAHWDPLTPEQKQQLQSQPAGPNLAAPKPLTRASVDPGQPNTSVDPLPPRNPAMDLTVSRPDQVDDMTPTPGAQPSPERVSPTAPAPSATRVAYPKPETPQYRETPRYTRLEDAVAALGNTNTDPKGRRMAAQFVMDSSVANLTQEDRGMLRSIMQGANGPEQQQFIANGRDRWLSAQAEAAPAETKQDPQAFGSFMGQAQQMWDGMGTAGQVAAMIGIPAAVFGMMGNDGITSLLGGLGLGALGVGAGAMGYLGEGMQANMGRMVGEVGNFFGAIPDEARNADILNGGGAQQAVQQQMQEAFQKAVNQNTADPTNAVEPFSAALQAGRAALQKQRAKFEPLLQIYNTNPELAYSYLMGMRGPNAPKSREEAAAAFARLKKQYDDSGREGYLEQQAQQYALEQGGQALETGGQAIGDAVNAISSFLNKPASDRTHWRGLAKQAMSAMDQKELNDLKQQDPQTLDEKKVRRLKELQARHAETSPKERVVTVCMKAARCWAGYEAVPGAKAYSRGSCRPVGSKKTQKEMKNGTERQHEKVKQSGAASRPQVSAPTTQRPGARTKTSGRPARH